jgi:hypothetical protein
MKAQRARSLAPERLIAVSVVTDADEERRLFEAWEDHDIPIPRHTISSPIASGPNRCSTSSTSSTPKAQISGAPR